MNTFRQALKQFELANEQLVISTSEEETEATARKIEDALKDIKSVLAETEYKLAEAARQDSRYRLDERFKKAAVQIHQGCKSILSLTGPRSA